MQQELSPEEQQFIEEQNQKVRNRTPQFEMMMNPIKSITKKPEFIKGAKVEVSANMSPNFLQQYAMVFPLKSNNPQKQMMGFTGQPSFQSVYQYVLGNPQSYKDIPKLIMVGRSESNGRLDVQLIKQFGENTVFKTQLFYPNASLEHMQTTFEVDHTSDDYNLGFKLGTGFWNIQMMQKISKLILGFELLSITQKKINTFNYNLRYQHRQSTYYAQYMAPMSSINLAYKLNPNRKMMMVSELEYNTMTGETNAVLGYRHKFSSSDFTGTINGKGKVSSIFSFNNTQLSLKLCGVANFIKPSYKFGFGISLGQQQ